jgi:HEAT repeats
MTRGGTRRRTLGRIRATIAVATICLPQFVGCGGEPPSPLTGGKSLSYWLQAVRAPDASVRKKAVFELGNVGPTDPAVIPALKAALQDREAPVRREALLALLKAPTEAGDALPTVQFMADRDPDPAVRNYAARAAKKLEGSTPPVGNGQ